MRHISSTTHPSLTLNIAGKPLAELCYSQEGDEEFLCCSTYDAWMETMAMLRVLVSPDSPVATLRLLLPTVSALVDANNGLFEPFGDAAQNAVVRDVLVRQAAAIAKVAHDKMSSDSAPNGRLASTLQLLRACRMFDHRLVASMETMDAILAESEQLLALPSASAAAVCQRRCRCRPGCDPQGGGGVQEACEERRGGGAGGRPQEHSGLLE